MTCTKQIRPQRLFTALLAGLLFASPAAFADELTANGQKWTVISSKELRTKNLAELVGRRLVCHCAIGNIHTHKDMADLWTIGPIMDTDYGSFAIHDREAKFFWDLPANMSGGILTAGNAGVAGKEWKHQGCGFWKECAGYVFMNVTGQAFGAPVMEIAVAYTNESVSFADDFVRHFNFACQFVCDAK